MKSSKQTQQQGLEGIKHSPFHTQHHLKTQTQLLPEENDVLVQINRLMRSLIKQFPTACLAKELSQKGACQQHRDHLAAHVVRHDSYRNYHAYRVTNTRLLRTGETFFRFAVYVTMVCMSAHRHGGACACVGACV